MRNVIVILTLLCSSVIVKAQFEKLIGNTNNNRVGKMILHDNHYYVLGQNGNKATVTKMTLAGVLLWTNQTNEDGWWNDVVVNKDGNLMTVGYQGISTLPNNWNSNVGIINTNNGNFISIRTYDFAFRDFFSKIFENPLPSNPSFPYYVIGLQINISGTNDDRVSVNMMNSNGVINTRRLISGPQDLQVHSGFWVNNTNGDFALIGNKFDSNVFEGAAVNFDKHATSTFMTELNKPVLISNTLQSGTNFIYSGQTTDAPQKGLVWKQVGNTNYSYTIDGLSNILNTFLDPTGTTLYALGVESASPNRRVLLTLDNTQNTMPIVGARYFTNGETAFTDGFANIDSNQRILFTDTRTGNPNNLGQQDGLVMVMDLSLQNCLSDTISGFVLRPYEITTSINAVVNDANTPPTPQIFNGTIVSYQMSDPCAAPCNISLQVNKSVDACSNATFTGTATSGTGPYTYQWDISCNGVDGTTNPFTTQIGSGTIPFCVTVTDATGCTAVLSNQTVVGVRDIIKPVVICPDDIQLTNNPGRCFATFAPVITVTDNCDPQPNCTCTMTGNTIGNMPKNTLVQFNVGTTTVTCTATDATGNVSDSCSFTVIVADTQNPTITCPSNISISCDQNVNNTLITGQATATDNCPEIVVNYTDNFNGNACSGTITRTWKATDESGNMSTCIQIIVIEDKEVPAISCPAFITINCDQQPLPSLTGTPQVVDNCQTGITPTYTDNVIGTGCNQYIQRIWTVSDGCGNTATCTQNIYFDDQIAPIVVCPPNLAITCLPADWQTANFGTATGTDNCGSVTISNFERTFSGSNCNGTITSKWRAIDQCGIQNECLQTITVMDNIAPMITCPPNLTLSCNANTTPSSTGDAQATDNCASNISIRHTDAYIAQGCIQDLIRTWTATDACGNVDTCVQTIILIDTILPNIVCPPNLTLSCGANTSTTFTGEPTASDFCQSNLIVTYVDVNSGTPCDVTITRTWTANDGCGNVSTCVQTIKVEDKTPPTFICPPSNVIPIECTANPNLGVPTNLMDNCGGRIDQSKVDVFSTDGCITTVTRTWTVTDQCGNTATCDQVILMQDTKAPIITNCGRKFTIQGIRNPDGICYGNATISTPNVTDACSSNVNITNSFNNTPDASSGNYPVGQTIVTWTAKDDCGLMAMCMDTVMVLSCSDCNSCDEVQIIARPIQVDSATCCYALDLNNPCDDNPFGKIEIESLTSGTIFGSHTKLSTWSYCDPPTPIELCLDNGQSNIPQGLTQNILQFCIDSSKIIEDIGCWEKIAAGTSHSVAIQIDGSLWAWGNNNHGQLGDGTNLSKNIPTRIGVGIDWKEIAAGEYYTVAIKTDGSLWAWGNNNHGQLGDGTNLSKNIPTRIGTGIDWKEIAPGSNHILAIKTDGSLWAWGQNNTGKLGDGTNISKNIPTRIGTNNDWQVISAGGDHSLGIRSNGNLFAWGNNAYAQLGFISLNVNVPVSIGSNWKAISASTSNSFGIKSNGSLWAFGFYYNGKTGATAPITTPSPTQISNDNWSFVSTDIYGSSNCIKSDGSLWRIQGFNISQIGIEKNWLNISRGSRFGIKVNNELWAWG